MTLIDFVMGRRMLTLTETERALVMRKGRFDTILGPGRHGIARRNIDVLRFDMSEPHFKSDYIDALVKTRPDLAHAHLTEVRTGTDEVAILNRDGRAFEVVTPDQRTFAWTDAGPWTVDRIDLTEGHEVPAALAQRLMRSGLTRALTSTEVSAGHVGILSIDGVVTRQLPSGTHWFWMLGRKHGVKLVDTRWQAHEVSGQEILTRDRVSLRVNLSADYRVTDPMRAVAEARDFAGALHLSLQLAFRKTLGALTLDEVLADKVSVSADAAAQVRTDMAALGIEVGEIALKDVILPGEMRDILNQVVAAQKEAEANVIRRREETNATRSLLNTAKVMAEHPVMLRLKELEALETIAGKVERLTVHNGAEGLMRDIVRLQD
ncbi:slipin family protein [uncultured Tateyamaria sp.]|uniref:slipin family protein n=1 Tax=uncultured Tateyamaria sp. TaxID=455651 RepID=UPI002607BE4F|nr:slipin family protein [uncultured Tateyamaria sp.]